MRTFWVKWSIRGHPQRTSAIFRGGGGTQLQTFADSRGGGVSGMQTSAFLKKMAEHIPHNFFLQFVLLRKRYTLAAEMFGVGDFWLEIRVCNYQILFHPWYPRTFEGFFIKMKQKNKKIRKVQNGRLEKNLVFQNRQFSKIFCQNFKDWSLD